MSSKIGRLSLTLKHYDAQIEAHRQAILVLQRARVKASIDARRAIAEESARRSAAKKQTEAA